MHTHELFQMYPILHIMCSEFIAESCGPMLKLLPKTYSNCHKVKVRAQKRKDDISPLFNDVFNKYTHNIRQRSVFVSGILCENDNNELEPFYIFPIDGYKFIYNKLVNNSLKRHTTTLTTLSTKLGADVGSLTLSELLESSYSQTNISDGISSGAEIIIYDIPIYYAVRVAATQSYHSITQ